MTVAVAVGWPVFEQCEMRLATQLDQDVLRFAPSSQGRAIRVVTEVDGTACSRRWLSTISPDDHGAGLL